MLKTFSIRNTVFFLLVLIPFANLYANQTLISKISGDVQILKSDQAQWAKASVSLILDSGDKIKTGRNASAELVTMQGHSIKVSENSEIEISLLEIDSTKTRLNQGRVRSKTSRLRPNEVFEVQTPNATCAVRGTDFEVKFINKVTQVTVFEGLVAARELITGQSVSIGPGRFSLINTGSPPTAPGEFELQREGGLRPAAEGRLAGARREIFEEISKQEVLSRAVDEMKNAEYQNGKSLMDAYGKRIRLEEYIIRPQTDQFKYVVLNKREDRFDFGKILFTFNKDLPEDLRIATKDMFYRPDEAPEWYPTDALSIMSNTIDTVTEIAGGGHPEESRIGNSLYYYTVFDTYDFYANDLRLWGYDRTINPNVEYYYGKDLGKDPAKDEFFQPSGSRVFHFIARDTYWDGTWIQLEDFIIDDEGKIASFGDIVDPSNVSAGDIRSRILQLNFQRVYTSSLFGNRKIDLVFSSKLLSDAGVLDLPTELKTPSASITAQSNTDNIQLARLRKPVGGELPEPVMPYDDDTAIDPARALFLEQFLAMELLGGQYFVDGKNTSFRGNADVIYTPVINFSSDTALLPIYNGTYRGTKDVQELVGGGTLTKKSMTHGVYLKGVHKMPQDYLLKGSIGYRGQWLSETEDEKLSDGLFNNNRYTAGFSAEKEFRGIKYRAGYDFGITDYTNYKALSSDSRFEEAGVTSSMGVNVLDFKTHSLSFGGLINLSGNFQLDSRYAVSYLNFDDQKIVQRSGGYSSSKRTDLDHTLSVQGVLNSRAARLGLGYGIRYYDSKQNAYDANRTYFTQGYYDFIEHRISPSLSFYLNPDKTSLFSLWWDTAVIKYSSRKAQSIEGNYGDNNLSQMTNSFGVWLKYPVYKQLSARAQASYLMSSSNTKYERVYRYNYDVVNYFLGLGYEF